MIDAWQASKNENLSEVGRIQTSDDRVGEKFEQVIDQLQFSRTHVVISKINLNPQYKCVLAILQLKMKEVSLKSEPLKVSGNGRSRTLNISMYLANLIHDGFHSQQIVE